MKRNVIGFLLSMSLLASPLAAHAGRDSGGADSKAIDDSAAWFLGAGKKIRTCFVRSPDFQSVDAEAALTTAFATWKKYIAARADDFKAPFTLATDPELMPACDGTEDLKIYLGVQSPEVLAAQAQYNSPMAFAQRTSYSLKTGWGKGFIWIANNPVTPIVWTRPYALLGIMLHELGHVLGCGHIEGTIMTEYIAALAQRTMATDFTDSEGKATLASIDNRVQLSTCSACVHGKYTGRVTDEGAAQARATFKLFAGRNAVGKIRAEFPIPTNVQTLPPASAIYFDLILKDDKGSVKVPLHLSPASTNASGSIAVFKMAIATDVAPDGTIMGSQGGGVIPTSHAYFGNVRDANGAAHDFVMDQNNTDPVRIKFYTGYDEHKLFVSDSYGLLN